MNCRPNKVRAKLAEGKVAVGTVMYSWSPNVMEVAGCAGLDFMRIDNEHAWRQDSSAEHLMRAAALSDVVPIHRVDRENPYLIRKSLEIGAGGIVVPDVSSPEDARAVVRASKFPPRGMRGLSGQCFSAGWGSADVAEWIEWSDTEPMIGVMIENVEAMKCVDEILTVDGVDFALFGPADYSMSLGLRRSVKTHKDVEAGLKKTIAAARKVGKHVMLGVGSDQSQISRYMDMGVTMLELASDVAVLRSAWSRAREAIYQAPSSKI
jgi:4-hydroxy-2-oxoheptanedioate aldolase